MAYSIPPRILTPEAYLTPPPKTVPASPIMTVAIKSKSQDPATPGGSRSPGLPFKTVGSPIPETALIPIDPSSTPSTDLSAVDRVQVQKNSGSHVIGEKGAANTWESHIFSKLRSMDETIYKQGLEILKQSFRLCQG